MKHLFTSTLFLLGLLLSATTTAEAYDFEVDGIYYDINGNEATVTYKELDSGDYHGDVNIPTSVTFNGTTYSVTAIGPSAFELCTGLTSVNIPNSVTEIAFCTFGGCTGLTRVNIPNSVTTIGESAFVNCTGLTSINIPNSVTIIGRSAFRNCTGLTSIDIPNSVTTIGISAFSGCTGLTSIDIPKSITTISEYTFSASGLTSISIPNSITTIDNCAFENCSGLTSIIIPNSVTFIGISAFSGCTGLTNIDIPNSVTHIDYGAFQGCTGLTDVYSYISDLSRLYMGWHVFSGYASNYPERTLHVPFRTLAAYEADSNWSAYFSSIVEMIDSFEVDGIYYIIVNDNEVEVTNNPNHDYSGNITIPNSITYDGMIYSVTSIREGAFADCNRLTSVTIPSSMTVVGKQAFMNDAALETVTCNATTPPSCDGLDIFPTNVYNHSPLFVPMGCEKAYKSDLVWGQFAKIIGPGDVNMDGTLSISDVIELINKLTRDISITPADDANGDGDVNISDVIALINRL